MKITSLKETYIYHHTGKVQKDVKIGVEVNYQTGKISLVNDYGKAMNFVFADRTLGYMQGWQDILDAIKAAVSDAEARLQEYETTLAQEAEELFVNRINSEQ